MYHLTFHPLSIKIWLMKKIFKFIKPFIIFGFFYFLWFDYTVYLLEKNPAQFEKDLPTTSAIMFFAITSLFLIYIGYKLLKFVKLKFKK